MKMKQLKSYINIRKGKSVIHVNDNDIAIVIEEELDKLGSEADLNHIDTSKVTDMYCLFSDLGDTWDNNNHYKDVNPDISKWNVSNVKDMRYMFYKCYNFNCDISEWDVSNVEMSQFMFKGCKSFNQDLSSWTLKSAPVKNSYDYVLDLWFEDCPLPNNKRPVYIFAK